MKRIALTVLILFTSLPAFAAAGWNTKVSWSDIGLWRGIPVTDPSTPQVSGSFNYEHSSGVYVGALAQNVTSIFKINTEFHHYLGYNYRINDMTIAGEFYRYYMPQRMDFSTYELRVKFAWKALNAMVAYMPTYFWGADADANKNWTGHASVTTSDIFVTANYVIPIDEHVSIVPDVGYQMYSKENASGNKGYFNYSLVLRTASVDGFSADFGYSGTNRVLLNPLNDTQLGGSGAREKFIENWGMAYVSGAATNPSKNAYDGRFFIKATKSF